MASEPATWGAKRRVLDALDKVHLARPAARGYELSLAAAALLRRNGAEAADGLPLPPARLRAQVGPRHADPDYFLRSGREQAEIVRSFVAESGSSVDDLDALLDWGCGCGRVLRNWATLERTRVAGCDIDTRMVEWCAKNLPFVDVNVNQISPPLPYPDASFDLVYAFSVMTHLDAELQHAWMREIARVLKPRGLFLFSTMGEHYLSLGRLNRGERARFESGDVVVLYEGSPGTSLCSAYHPPDYVRSTLAADYEFVSFRAAADYGRHDIHLFRKP